MAGTERVTGPPRAGASDRVGSGPRRADLPGVAHHRRPAGLRSRTSPPGQGGRQQSSDPWLREDIPTALGADVSTARSPRTLPFHRNRTPPPAGRHHAPTRALPGSLLVGSCEKHLLRARVDGQPPTPGTGTRSTMMRTARRAVAAGTRSSGPTDTRQLNVNVVGVNGPGTYRVGSGSNSVVTCVEVSRSATTCRRRRGRPRSRVGVAA